MDDTPPRGGGSTHSSSPLEVKEVRITRPIVPALKLPSSKENPTTERERPTSGHTGSGRSGDRSDPSRSGDRSGGSAEDSQPNSARSVHSARSVTNSVSSFTTLSARSNPNSGRTGEDSPRLRPFSARRMLELQQDADRWRSKAIKLQKQLEEGVDARLRKMDLEIKTLNDRLKKKDEMLEQTRQRERKIQQKLADTEAKNREQQIEIHRQDKVIRDFRIQQIKQEVVHRCSNSASGRMTGSDDSYSIYDGKTSKKRSSSASARAVKAKQSGDGELKLQDVSRQLARTREEFAAKQRVLQLDLQREKQENLRLRNELESLKPTVAHSRRVSFGETQTEPHTTTHGHPQVHHYTRTPTSAWDYPAQISPRSPRATPSTLSTLRRGGASPPIIPPMVQQPSKGQQGGIGNSSSEEESISEQQVWSEIKQVEDSMQHITRMLAAKKGGKKFKQHRKPTTTTTTNANSNTSTVCISIQQPPVHNQGQAQQAQTSSQQGTGNRQPPSPRQNSPRSDPKVQASAKPRTTTNTGSTRPPFVPALSLGAATRGNQNFSPPPPAPPPPYHAPSSHPTTTTSSVASSQDSDGYGTNSLASVE